ncbi:MAG: PepSY-associated TM helix domain-containing protein [Salinivirgaceae bacterium]|nr:PepSY-associated TM helix domain-containing protein [Salinivirgaceae bacterium]
MSWNSRLTRVLRNWHRDLGYFTVAVTIVYALSGIFLTHKESFPVITTNESYSSLSLGLSIGGFSEQWEMQYPKLPLTKCFVKGDKVQFYYKGGKGNYDAKNGKVAVEYYKKNGLIAFVNKLHFNQANGWKYFADFFSGTLIFLAISGLFMVKGKNGFKKRGIWLMLLGIVLILIFI